MLEILITALVSSAGTLVVSMITLFVKAHVEERKIKLEIQQKEYQTKREYLTPVYKELISIINLYPEVSPNDILEHIDFAPNYLMENFDSTITILDYQIEDYKEQLKNTDMNRDRKNDIDLQISNREYAKNKIAKVRDEYCEARGRYQSFCKSDKVGFDLYAGQDVRNCLVEFEATVSNVFISGQRAEHSVDSIKNMIQISRRNLINSMRQDIGIY